MRLWEVIGSSYIDDLDGASDMGAVQDALNTRLDPLDSELHQVRQLFCASCVTVLGNHSVLLAFLADEHFWQLPPRAGAAATGVHHHS